MFKDNLKFKHNSSFFLVILHMVLEFLFSFLCLIKAYHDQCVVFLFRINKLYIWARLGDKACSKLNCSAGPRFSLKTHQACAGTKDLDELGDWGQESLCDETL